MTNPRFPRHHCCLLWAHSKYMEICHFPAMRSLGARSDQVTSGHITPKPFKIVGKTNDSTSQNLTITPENLTINSWECRRKINENELFWHLTFYSKIPGIKNECSVGQISIREMHCSDWNPNQLSTDVMYRSGIVSLSSLYSHYRLDPLNFISDRHRVCTSSKATQIQRMHIEFRFSEIRSFTVC